MTRLALLALFLLFAPAATGVENAVAQAIAAFDRAEAQLGEASFGVDVKAYGNALRHGRFNSAYWGAAMSVDIVQGAVNEVGCQRFAAYVPLPPRDRQILLVICPEFSTPGAESLRRLTILHELVHVVAGPDECRAMAFAARVEKLALGRFTPVERYWRVNDCARSGYSLP